MSVRRPRPPVPQVETRLREEVDRAVQYLDASTMSKLISVVENEFIPEQAKTLVEVRTRVLASARRRYDH